MSKFAGTVKTPHHVNLKSPVQTIDKVLPTFEGGDGYARTAESDLFLLAATNMSGEDTFYESAKDRDERFVSLIKEVVATNPEFISGNLLKNKVGLAEYLRNTLLMRSASVVLAAEYVAARGPNARSVVERVLQRPDEPAEILGYWLSKYGRPIPNALRRGVSDALTRLYTEKNALRYDGLSKGIRFGDVIELVHPRPANDYRNALYKYLLDERHHQDGLADPAILSVIAAAKALAEVPEDERREYLQANPEALVKAGWSWERLSGWLPGGMDAEAWSHAVTNMGVMALVRNLRNFDQAGIDNKTIDFVISKITDEEEVAKARLFPYQVWSAYKNAPSDNWKRALGTTLDLTTRNIPDLSNSLVVVDTSGSMQGGMSRRGTIANYEVAGVLAAALITGVKDSDLVIFGERNKKVDFPAGTSALKVVERIRNGIGEVGHSTYGHTAIRDHFNPARHQRVFLVTDDQQADSASLSKHVPLIYTINLAGYRASSTKAGDSGRHTFGGFTDSSFQMVKVLEESRNAVWPF